MITNSHLWLFGRKGVQLLKRFCSIIWSLIFFIFAMQNAYAVVTKERTCNVDLFVYTTKNNRNVESPSLRSFQSWGYIRAPGNVENITAPTSHYTANARTLAYNAMSTCLVTAIRNPTINIAQHDACRITFYGDCTAQWRHDNGLLLCPQEHSTTSRSRGRVLNAPWESPVRIIQKYICSSAGDGFPKKNRVQMLFKGTGRQTCRSDVPQRGAEMQLSTSTIDRLTDEVFGTGLFVLKCEQGQPRTVPRSIQRKQIKRLPTNPKITRIPNYLPKKE